MTLRDEHPGVPPSLPHGWADIAPRVVAVSRTAAIDVATADEKAAAMRHAVLPQWHYDERKTARRKEQRRRRRMRSVAAVLVGCVMLLGIGAMALLHLLTGHFW